MSETTMEITTLGEKGQVVIPKALRDRLGIKARTRFVVFGKGDTIVLKRLEVPDVRRELEEIFASIDATGLHFTEEEIDEEIQAYRREKRERGSSSTPTSS